MNLHAAARAVARGAAAAAVAVVLAGTAAAETSKNQAQFDTGVVAYESGDYLAAFKAWLPLAYDDDPAAQRNLAHLYRMGLGVTQDFEKAAQWYRRAAELGLARAQANLAHMYLRGQGVKKDVAEAARWFGKAAEQGDVASQYNLGLLYENGTGVRTSDADAVRWYYLAAKAGHAKALSRMALLISKTAPPELAEQLLGGGGQPAAPAAATAPPARTDDEDQGVRLQRAKSGPPSASTASPPATAATGATAPEAPPAAPVAPPPPPAQAEATDPAAADGNGRDRGAGSSGLLGTLRSLFGPPSPENAETSPTGTAPAASVPAPTPAPPPAQTAAVPADPAPPAADAGGPPASSILDAGLAAYRERDYTTALAQWLPLAQRGNANAQFLVGGLFADGAGVARDPVRAHAWWSLAATQGHDKALTFRENLRLEMNPDQIVAASNLMGTLTR